MLAWMLALGTWVWAQEPSEQTLIYYNARMALREGEPLEATKLWLLRNAVEDHTGRVSPYDEDFHSITWVALGELGICQDGYPLDRDAAGLWPLALHNWVVRNRNRTKGKRPNPYRGFEVERQQRFISIDDVLSAEELESVDLFRGGCTRPRIALLDAGESITAKLSDRFVAARLMKYLLELGRSELNRDRVRGSAAVQARLFDVHLQIMHLSAREARRKASQDARSGRVLGMSAPAVQAIREDAPEYTFDASSAPARILRACVQWSGEEWMSLSPERRLFLFDHARTFGGDPEALDRVALSIIDALIARGEGAEVERWIAHRNLDPEAQEPVWSGERGERLLALGRESGFQERAVIAIHRAVRYLEQGQLEDSLRSLAYALQHAPDSRAGDDIQALSLRWLSYIASQFEITDELLVMLQEIVPRREYSLLLEDLMWGAAFRADASSFERGIRNQLGRGALERRMALLEPLASGNVRLFVRQIDAGLQDSPNETMRFLDQMVQRLELEDGDVRSAHVPTLARVRRLVAPLADGTKASRMERRANALLDRSQAVIEGLGELPEGASLRDRAQSFGPSGEVFAGSVRLAPSDPLPWPFRAVDVAAPSIFEPMELIPIEWRDEEGDWVFGWSIRG